MQNRSFDIAEPNPTPEEQKKIDEQYTRFLDEERQSRLAAEARAKSQLLQPASLRSAPGSLQSEKVPLPAAALNKQPGERGRTRNLRIARGIVLLRLAAAIGTPQ